MEAHAASQARGAAALDQQTYQVYGADGDHQQDVDPVGEELRGRGFSSKTSHTSQHDHRVLPLAQREALARWQCLRLTM